VNISKEEFEGIKRKREEALAQRKGKPKGTKGKGKGSGSRASTLGRTSIDDKVCRAWRKGRPCPRVANGLACPYEHPPQTQGAGQQAPAATAGLPTARVAIFAPQVRSRHHFPCEWGNPHAVLGRL
jgi:hypothetical protein